MAAAADRLDAPQESSMGVMGFLGRILRLLRPYRGACALVLVALLVEMGVSALIPLAFKYLIDNAIDDADRRLLALTLAALVAGVVLVTTMGVWRDRLWAKVVSGTLTDLRETMFGHLQRLSADFFARVRVGDILTRFSSDLASIDHTLEIGVPWAVLPGLNVAVSAVLLFGLEWRLALVASLVFPLSLVGPKILTPHATRAGHRRREDEALAVAGVQETIVSRTVIQAFGLERRFLARFRERTRALFESSVRVGFLSALLERTAASGILIVHVVVIGVGVLRVFDGSLTLGGLVAFQSLFVLMSTNLSYVNQYIPYLAQASASFQRVDAILRERPRVVEADDAVELPRLSREIRFEDVTFSYTGGRPTIRDVNLTIPAGQYVAFVGASGSGKSTVLNLLARFYDAGAGTVTVDGVDIRKATLPSLRGQLAVVFQQPLLFSTTVQENIGMGRPDASFEEIVEAAKGAEIHDFVEGLPDGYATVIGEGGVELSGGQRQRVSIARALVRDPTVLLLDEATSALDPNSEAAVQATIENVAEGRTILSVTHRLAQAVAADRIFVLDAGEVVESGAHEECSRSTASTRSSGTSSRRSTSRATTSGCGSTPRACATSRSSPSSTPAFSKPLPHSSSPNDTRRTASCSGKATTATAST
jgi:ATP-binding cassette subfamily B protein